MKGITRFIALSIFMLVFLFVGTSQSIGDQFFKDVDKFLKDRVSNGLVHYKEIKSDDRLPQLIQQIGEADLSSADAATKQAFYINAYNLHVINNVLDNYPTKSVLDEAGFFDTRKVKVAKNNMTLNELEKGKLLKVYKDPRFHFVLVCGAVGCPPITNFAYTPAQLEQQLEKQTKKALNNSSFIKAKDGDIELSEIFKWYADDFGSSNQNVIQFINKYRSQKISSGASIGYYEYNWKLNDRT